MSKNYLRMGILLRSGYMIRL